jgi:ketosteroid isomerase-like protein
MNGQSFDEFFPLRDKAAAAYVCGDFAPLKPLLVRSGGASFHSPAGDTVSGADKVAARYEKDAGSFAPGGKSRLEIVQKVDSGDVAYWTGFQIATVNMQGKDAPIDMRIRVTEIFRREGGEWRLAHRHADAAKS